MKVLRGGSVGEASHSTDGRRLGCATGEKGEGGKVVVD